MRGRPRKVLIAVTLSLLGILGASGLWVHLRIAARTAQMDRRIEELRRQALAVNPARQVLWGASVPGNAWDDYHQAMATGANRVSITTTAAILDPDVLSLFRNGAHRECSQREIVNSVGETDAVQSADEDEAGELAQPISFPRLQAIKLERVGK